MDEKRYLLLVRVFGTDEYKLLNSLPNTMEHLQSVMNMIVDFNDTFEYQYIDVTFTGNF